MKFIPFYIILLVISFSCTKTDENKRDKSLQIIKNYSENYFPKIDSNFPIAKLEQPQSEVINAIRFLLAINDTSYCKYIMLILLKLYHSHLDNHHQSYDLRPVNEIPKNPSNDILKAFCKIAKLKGYQIEFMSSQEPFDFVNSNNEFLCYDPIGEEMHTIDSIKIEIDKLLKE